MAGVNLNGVDLSGNQLSVFATVLIGLAGMFGATIYTLQTRHHSIYVHEVAVQDECYKLHCKANRSEEDDAKLRNLKRQLRVIRWRYNFALCAYILIMVQELVVVVYATSVLINIASGTKIHVEQSWLTVFLSPGGLSLACHIGGDLALAGRQQYINRTWWNYIRDRSVKSKT